MNPSVLALKLIIIAAGLFAWGYISLRFMQAWKIGRLTNTGGDGI